jgi:hypothetical protein
MMRTILDEHIPRTIRTANTHFVETNIIRTNQTQCKIIAAISGLVMQLSQTTIT